MSGKESFDQDDEYFTGSTEEYISESIEESIPDSPGESESELGPEFPEDDSAENVDDLIPSHTPAPDNRGHVLESGEEEGGGEEEGEGVWEGNQQPATDTSKEGQFEFEQELTTVSLALSCTVHTYIWMAVRWLSWPWDVGILVSACLVWDSLDLYADYTWVLGSLYLSVSISVSALHVLVSGKESFGLLTWQLVSVLLFKLLAFFHICK